MGRLGERNMKSSPLFILFVLSSISLLHRPHAAASAASKRPYIVYLGGHSHGPEATLEDYERATESHYSLLGSFLGSEEKARSAIFYSYQKNINGFAAMLDEEEALQIAKHPDVISVFPSRKMKLHTTRSWHDLALEKDGKVIPGSLWAKANFGEDVIIGNLDTGVWPESRSFNDQGMGPVPSRWKGYCQNNTKQGVLCNRKLIGARYFKLGLPDDAANDEAVLSPRDTEGHGTHTLSTAAGRFVPGASIYGHANGTAKGGSPNARVAAYKVCWPGEDCSEDNILAGFEAAIHDGVDVLSVSLGGDAYEYSQDVIAIGAFHAVQRGITVVCSAGNTGPFQGTVSNIAPWIITVAASTIDRSFPAPLVLGNKKQIKGESVSAIGLRTGKLYPLINAHDAKAANATVEDANTCAIGALDPKKVKGKIVICRRGVYARVVKGLAAQMAGAAGMVLVNDHDSGNALIADAHVLPATMITYQDGITLQSYMNSTKTPMGYVSKPKTAIGVKPAPKIAAFSSHGPNEITPEILKPDITAPGVSILAAFTEGNSPSEQPEDKRRVPYVLMSGTSMSCPHVAGIAGLLKKLHPDWSPAAIRSAIMTTARTRDNTGSPMRESYNAKASPFGYGAGHVRPNRAMDPGLVYDIETSDYLNFFCALGYRNRDIPRFSGKPYTCPANPPKVEDLNYPSITVPDLPKNMTVTRTLKNVGAPGKYRVRVRAPYGITVAVRPAELEFRKAGEEKTFQVTLRARRESSGVGYVFGDVVWSDGKHRVRSPLAVNVFS